MRNKGIVIELTALLDVILIMLFWVMLNMERETEKIKTDAAEKAAEYEHSAAVMSEELDDTREMYSEILSQYENIQAEYQKYVEENTDLSGEIAKKALDDISKGKAVTITPSGDNYVIFYDNQELSRIDSYDKSADISGAIMAALDKAGFEKDDVIIFAFVYNNKKILRNDRALYEKAAEKVKKLYDNFYFLLISTPN